MSKETLKLDCHFKIDAGICATHFRINYIGIQRVFSRQEIYKKIARMYKWRVVMRLSSLHAPK